MLIPTNDISFTFIRFHKHYSQGSLWWGSLAKGLEVSCPWKISYVNFLISRDRNMKTSTVDMKMKVELMFVHPS